MEKTVRVGVGVFIFREGKFLMLKRKSTLGKNTWALPGGGLDFGESFEAAARREVLEETGLSIQNIRVGTVTNDYFPDEEKHYITIWMLSEYAGGEPSIMEPEKCEAQEWYTFDTLPEPLFAWDTLKASGLLEQLRTEMHS